MPSPPAQTQSRFAKQQQQDQADEPDLTHHASSILGSLALDSDPTDDPLAHSSSSATANFNNTAPAAPPGLSTPAAVNLAEQTWQYRDPSGQIQGPFAAPMMHSWFESHFFSPDLRVRRTQEREFETLENLIRRSGDPDTPFLTATLQPVATLPPPASAAANQDAAGGWPLGPSTPLDQFSSAGGGAQRAFGSFYEPFGAAPSASSSSAFEAPGQQAHSAFGFAGQQSRQGSSQGGGLDPWGAPLPVASPAAAAPWNEQPNLFAAAGGAYGQHQPQQQPFAQASPAFAHQQQPHSPFQQHQQQPHHQQQQQNPVDIFRQLTQQQQHGHQQPQQFFDPAAAAGHQQDWRQAPPQQQQQLGQQHPQQQQQSWSSLLPSRLDNLVGAGSPALSPIGPPSAQQSPAVAFAQQPTPAPVSPWGAVAPVVEQPTPAPSAPVVKEEQQQLPPPIAAPKEFAAIGKPVVEKIVKEQVKDKEAKPASSKKEIESTPAAAPVKEEPIVSAAPSPSPSPAPKSSAAPWSAPVSSAPATPSGPFLREIQEVEAREADKRKAAARVQAAQANIQAAQRIAAQEAAEQLPASVQWATGGSSAPVAPGATAPWSKPAAAGKVAGGKTLKEIQEEEERRKKAQAAQAALTSAPAAGVRGYAGSIGQMAAAKVSV